MKICLLIKQGSLCFYLSPYFLMILIRVLMFTSKFPTCKQRIIIQLHTVFMLLLHHSNSHRLTLSPLKAEAKPQPNSRHQVFNEVFISPGVPSAPGRVVATRNTRSSVFVQWEAPKHTKNLMGYYIDGRVVGAKEWFACNHKPFRNTRWEPPPSS